MSDKITPVTPINVAYDQAVRPEVNVWGASASAMHVPTGLFLQGLYTAADFKQGTATDGGACTASSCSNGTSGYWGQSTVQKKDAAQWLIQGGVSKNWFGYGNTSTYGEYGENTGWGASFNPLGRDYTSAASVVGLTSVIGVTDTTQTVWGFGIAQKFDAAATDIYLGYRHFDADITCIGAGASCTGAAVSGSPRSCRSRTSRRSSAASEWHSEPGSS